MNILMTNKIIRLKKYHNGVSCQDSNLWTLYSKSKAVHQSTYCRCKNIRSRFFQYFIQKLHLSDIIKIMNKEYIH